MLILFKLVLIGSIIVLAYLVSFRPGSYFIQRVVGLALGLGVCVFITVPSWSTSVANFFGIGRGADFLFYLGHVVSFYLIVVLYRRVQYLQRQLTQVVREQALSNARLINSSKP